MNIDPTAIEGFDAMSDADKVAALLKLEVPDKVDLSKYVSKETFDKTSSELAAAKKAIREKQTDEEAAKEKEAADRKELEDKYNALLETSTISGYEAKYLAQGYDPALAKETATALFKGDMEKVFANSEKFKADFEKKIKADAVKDTPKPGGAGGNEEKQANVEYAKQIGKARAEALKSANEGIKNYL